MYHIVKKQPGGGVPEYHVLKTGELRGLRCDSMVDARFIEYILNHTKLIDEARLYAVEQHDNAL